MKLVNSQEKKWNNIYQSEMKAFIGIVELYIGIISKLIIHDYWNKSQLFGTPGIRCTVFLLI